MVMFKYVSGCVPPLNLDPQDSRYDGLEIGQAFWAGILILFPPETKVVKINRGDWKKLKGHVMLEGKHLGELIPDVQVWRYLELVDGRTNLVIFLDEVREYVRDIYEDEGDEFTLYHITKSLEGKPDSYYKEILEKVQELRRLCGAQVIFAPDPDHVRDFSDVLAVARKIQERRDALKREAGLS